MPQMFYLKVSEPCGVEAKDHSNLVYFNNNQQLVILEVHYVALANDRRDLLDHGVASQDVMIAKRRSNGKLFDVSFLALAVSLLSPSLGAAISLPCEVPMVACGNEVPRLLSQHFLDPLARLCPSASWVTGA